LNRPVDRLYKEKRLWLAPMMLRFNHDHVLQEVE